MIKIVILYYFSANEAASVLRPELSFEEPLQTEKRDLIEKTSDIPYLDQYMKEAL